MQRPDAPPPPRLSFTEDGAIAARISAMKTLRNLIIISICTSFCRAIPLTDIIPEATIKKCVCDAMVDHNESGLYYFVVLSNQDAAPHAIFLGGADVPRTGSISMRIDNKLTGFRATAEIARKDHAVEVSGEMELGVRGAEDLTASTPNGLPRLKRTLNEVTHANEIMNLYTSYESITRQGKAYWRAYSLVSVYSTGRKFSECETCK